MNLNDLFAKIGQQQIALEQLNGAYDELLVLLSQVVSGEVDPSRILINLTERRWVKSEPGTRPGTPATINGLPQCVVAPMPPVEMPMGGSCSDKHEACVSQPN